jgi:hypothetical protein
MGAATSRYARTTEQRNEKRHRAEPWNRSGWDGAGWFLAALAIALFYGLGVSGLSRDDGPTVTGPLPDPPAAMVLHGGP